MTALGNDTPDARMLISSAGLFMFIANPFWGIPAAFLLGVYCRRK